MTRAEIAAHYVIVNGRIRSPGKFEGESVFAPHFYALVGLGEGEVQDDDRSVWIEPTDEDYAEFPELDPSTQWVQVYESDQGFIYCNELDEGGQPL